MTSTAASLLDRRTLDLLEQCAGFMRLGNGGTGINLSSLKWEFGFPHKLELMSTYLREQVEEKSSQTLTVLPADPALFQWHTYGLNCLYLATCPYETAARVIRELQTGIRLHQVHPGPHGLILAPAAPSWQVGRNRTRLRDTPLAA
ncbi:hypothetical protein EPO04_04190 [Patescibacteria group bacterium]|nr:MAG: hypothetical protein EPO04_04190 [Patescibacteria group bacterium]